MRKDLRKCANDDLNNNKAANTDEAELLLNNISSAVDTVTENLKTFVQCINELNNNNPGVYNEFKMMVKLPDENDIEKMVKLQQDINESIKILSDENFVNNLN